MRLLLPGVPLSKRILDLSITLVGLILISPVLVLIALLVQIIHGSPFLFRQVPPGYRGRLFELYKFRSMTEARDIQGRLLPDEQRLTRWGRFLRATSLDELPEVLNVLRGEMSLIGPRPLLMQYLERYTPEQARRHEVLHGMAGWAQVHGRNAITWEEKFRLDVWYVDHRSLRLALRILASPIGNVWRCDGSR